VLKHDKGELPQYPTLVAASKDYSLVFWVTSIARTNTPLEEVAQGQAEHAQKLGVVPFIQDNSGATPMLTGQGIAEEPGGRQVKTILSVARVHPQVDWVLLCFGPVDTWSMDRRTSAPPSATRCKRRRSWSRGRPLAEIERCICNPLAIRVHWMA
jgi:hypothetical protein